MSVSLFRAREPKTVRETVRGRALEGAPWIREAHDEHSASERPAMDHHDGRRLV